MSTQHTPGPWLVRERLIPYKDGSKSHVERTICTQSTDPQLKDHWPVVCMSLGLGMDDQKAVTFVHIKKDDARLIAAAPELLFELKKCASLLKTACSEIDDLTGKAVIAQRLESVTALIAKATGGT